MSFFDIFKRKQKPDKISKPSEVLSVAARQPKDNISAFIKVTKEILSSAPDDVIPVEKRIKGAIASKHGLYPHEVLVLDYAGSSYTDSNSFQGFWWYRYGVRDVGKCLHSMMERGFMQIGDIQVQLHWKMQQFSKKN